MKIAFFDVQDWEIKILKKSLSKHSLSFFHESLAIENVSKISDYEILSTAIYSKINKPILDKLPKLKYITTRSMGFDHIDLRECKKLNIKVSNVTHYGDNSDDEHAYT